MATKQARRHDITPDPIKTSVSNSTTNHNYHPSNSRSIQYGNAGHIPAWVFVIPALILAVAAAIFILNPSDNNTETSELIVGDNAFASDSAYVQQLHDL